MTEHIVATVHEIPPGGRKEVRIDGRSICVFNIDGEFFAIRNVCPHQGASLSRGKICGIHVCNQSLDEVVYQRAGEIIRCPWHGWEFDIKTGKSVFDPNGSYVKSYPVSVEPLSSEQVDPFSEPTLSEPILSEPFSSPEQPSVETYETSVRSQYVIIHT